MTIEQKNQLEKYRQEFAQNCKRYAAWGSERDCKFSSFESENEEDKNITLVVTTITGLSDDYQTYVETVNLMIEPDGNVINLFDVYEPSQVISYIQQLKKID